MLTMNQIRERLNEPGVNYSHAAKSVGVNKAYISMMASGKRKNPSSDLQEKISDYLIELDED